jgi:hypothetical protein
MISSDSEITGPILLAWDFEDFIRKMEGFYQDFCGLCLIELCP